MVHELCLQCNRMDQPGMMNVPLEFQLEHRMRTRTACSKCVLSKLASTRGLSAGQYAQDYYTPYQDSTGDGPGVAFTTVTCVPDDPVLHSQLADVELKFEDEMWRCTNPGCTNTISSVAVQLCLRGPTVCESSHYLCNSCMTTQASDSEDGRRSKHNSGWEKERLQCSVIGRVGSGTGTRASPSPPMSLRLARRADRVASLC
jgi:hypothetical protein